MATYTIGDIITYSTFGGTDRREVRVTAVEPDIKNGRAGFDGEFVTLPPLDMPGNGVWGYDYQITSINGVPVDNAYGVQ